MIWGFCFILPLQKIHISFTWYFTHAAFRRVKFHTFSHVWSFWRFIYFLMWFLHTGYYSHMWIYVIHRRMSFSVWFVYSLIIFQWFIYFHMWIFYDSFFFMCLFTWFICLHGLLFSCDFLFNSFIFICEILFTPLFLTWFSTWLIYFHFFLTINFSCEFFTRFLYFPDFFSTQLIFLLTCTAWSFIYHMRFSQMNTSFFQMSTYCSHDVMFVYMNSYAHFQRITRWNASSHVIV